MKHPYQILFTCACALAGALTQQPLHANESASRIVSIGGSATEIVYALGKGDEVVAVDLSSTYPPAATELPNIGYIRQIAPEGVLAMNPDLIVTNESLGPPAAKAALKRVSIPIVWCPEPDSPEALYNSIEQTGKALGQTEEAETLIAEVKQQLAQVESTAASWQTKPRVLFFMQPPSSSRSGLVAGKQTRADELILLAGGENVATDVTRYQPFALESIIAAQPDVILVGTGPGHGAGPESIEYVLNSQALANVPAVKNGHVVAVPMDSLNFGPRLGKAALQWNEVFAEAQKQ